MIPLQGTNTYLQGGTGYLQGSSPNLQQGVNPTAPQQPKPVVRAAAPQATAPSAPQQKYMQDLSGTYGLSGGTVYNKSTNTGLTLDQFKAATGIQNPDWKSLKFDTAYTPQLSSPAAQSFIGNQLSGPSPAPQPQVSAPKSAYLEYLRNQFNPQALESAQGSLNELNKRTSEELLRARAREDELRANKIGQVESGLNYGLSENARLSNKSLADLALAKGYQTENYNRLLGYGSSLYSLEQQAADKAGTMLKETAPALLSQFESLKTQPEKDAYIRSKATELGVSIDQVNSALQAAIQTRSAAQNKDLMSVSEGEAIWDPNTGQFVFKNPKTYEPNSANTFGSFELTSGQQTLLNGIINKYNASPVIMAADRAKGLATTIEAIKANPKDAALQLNLVYQYIGALDNYNSAVREGELALVGSLQSKIGAVQNAVEGINNTRKPVDARTALEIANAAEALVRSINEGAQQKARSYQSQAATFGLQDPWNSYISGFQPSYNGSSGSNPDDFINQVLGFNTVGKTSASTPYLSTLGSITGLNGSPLWKWGLDIDLKVGQPVKTPVGGQVIAVAPNGGFGNQVKIRAADGTEYWFSHLQKGSVKVGQTIPRGTVIGLGGNSGNTIPGKGGDGSHLDLTAKSKDGKFIPPDKIAAMLKQIFV